MAISPIDILDDGFFYPLVDKQYRTVVDVGANDGGDYSIPAVRDAHHVVYAFEPVPSTRARFIANVKNCGISNITTLIEVEPGKPVDMDKIRVRSRLVIPWMGAIYILTNEDGRIISVCPFYHLGRK